MTRKGLIMAGGMGRRLHPATQVVSKQLLPVYDKPMIYYPLSTLMQARIRDILIISTPEDLPRFHALLGDGSHWGINLQYAAQPSPDGLAQAFIIGRNFIASGPSAMILGDNIFYGNDLDQGLAHASGGAAATVFACHVEDPERYGVVSFDQQRKVIAIEEKPLAPRSSYAVTGLYFYDKDVCDIAQTIRPSARGELEITDINMHYLRQGKLNVRVLRRGVAWMDTGTHESLLDAGNFIATLQRRQGLIVGSPEEMAFRNRWIDASQLMALAKPLSNNAYGQYLMQLISDPVL